MMTKINSLDATYKAQFAELSEMGGAVESLENAGESLGEAVTSTSDANTIKSQLQTFVDRYNAWSRNLTERSRWRRAQRDVGGGGFACRTANRGGELPTGAAQGIHGLPTLVSRLD